MTPDIPYSEIQVFRMACFRPVHAHISAGILCIDLVMITQVLGYHSVKQRS